MPLIWKEVYSCIFCQRDGHCWKKSIYYYVNMQTGWKNLLLFFLECIFSKEHSLALIQLFFSATNLCTGNPLFVSWWEHLCILCLLVHKTASYVGNNGSPVPQLFSFQREMSGNPPCLSQKARLSSVNHSYPVTHRHGAGRTGRYVVPCAGLNFLRFDLFPPKRTCSFNKKSFI